MSQPDEQDFILTLWTANPIHARNADRAGVDRVGVDLEELGKAQRQAGLGTWMSPHRMDQLPAIAEQLSRADLFARTNPLNPHSRDEVEALLDMGVKVLMLPMFATAREVAQFAHLVQGRAKLVPLVETAAAAEKIKDIVALDEIEEIHLGINDLSLSLGFRNRFVVLTTDLVDRVAECVLQSGMCLGLAGIGRALDESMPLASDLVYAQYPRLGATAAIISQQFRSDQMTEVELCAEIQKARDRMAYWFDRDENEVREAHQRFCTVLEDLLA